MNGRSSQQRPIRHPELRPDNLTAQDVELVPQHQKLDVLHVQTTAAPEKRPEQGSKRQIEEGEGHVADPPNPPAQEQRHQYRRPSGFYGYRIHAAVCAVTGLPLAWQVETARSHESNYVAPLLDAVRARGFAPATVAMDMGYDNTPIYAECAERDVAAVIPLRRNSGVRESGIPRKSDEWRSLYRRRSAVEREFGRLKHQYGLAMLRVRGIERVRLHADLTMLARLRLALARARVVRPA
jgi:transposase